ncbi:hypothetical protein H634G_02531 [Metarhizium anisopliae BRIP 53293]|uniref:Uncharacterized protein n=1 Tax=Metarhizium anisopliae BRIP 53293 TaxID=1291518 RepID=A0A0D9P7U5_METAN|nr:hypothetical protein H634G_02531 [Metarhizium anisopliae BRIP 53293]KJK87492.1 hypothetical protein H633G_08657 [Metarhizium anisopliae BRIP 53284]
MKYIQLALATFAGLALAAPQNDLVKPTLEEISGDKEMTLERVFKIYNGYKITCKERFLGDISCSAPWNRGNIKQDPNAVNDIPRLCEKNGGCTKCFYDEDSNKNADTGSYRLEMAMLSTT